jgi:menaquinone-9 beta-reductase
MNSHEPPDFKPPPSAPPGPGGCCSSASVDELRQTIWDRIVIGAGPAGALSAILAARRGLKVLLLERSSWPREKTCGGCLSETAIDLLREVDLLHILDQGTPLARSFIHTPTDTAELQHNGTVAVSRDRFDESLVREFQQLGGTFVCRASAQLLTPIGQTLREVRVSVAGQTIVASAHLVLACDGIGGTSLAGEPWARWDVAGDSHMGASVCVSEPIAGIDVGAIHMHVGEHGYVGAVRYKEGNTHLAAALSAQSSRDAGGPAVVMEQILRSCGRNVDLSGSKVKGTPLLTRRRRAMAGHRVLAVGDAAGYVEPFTGEGMAWAMRSAFYADRIVSQGWSDAIPEQWAGAHANFIQPKQRVAGAIRRAVRSPALTSLAISALKFAPSISHWVTKSQGRPA